MTFTHYSDRDLARLAREAERGDKALADRVAYLERLGSWVRKVLYPATIAAAAAAGSAPPSPPPEP